MAATDSILHLADAQCDVTLSFLYGDAVAIEDATNAALRFDPETRETIPDASVLAARRDAMLTHIPKSWTRVDADGRAVPLTLDHIRSLSVVDGRALEAAVIALMDAAVAVHVEDSPKESPSSEPS